MNLNSENSSPFYYDSPTENDDEKVFTDLQPLSDFHADLPHSLSKKRKWGELTNPPVVSDPEFAEGQCSSEVNTDTVDDRNMCEVHSVDQCPPTAKKIKTMDKREINVLQIQIAMISDVDGDRPIHVAVAQENIKLVRKLCALMLKSAISLDLTNYLRQTPLHLAVMLGNTDMVNLLLKCGASIVLRDRNGNSVLHLAVKTKVKKDILEFILSHADSKTILNSLDYEGYSALHYAVLRNNEIAVKSLHSAGALLNTIDGKSGRSPLIHAVVEHNVKMVGLLLNIGASAEVTDYSGRSVFELALQSSNKKITKLLEKHLFVDPTLDGISQQDSKCKSTASSSSAKRTNSDICMKTNRNKKITLPNRTK